MKKSIRFLAFAVIAGSLFPMTACGEDEHQHTYSNAWSTNATTHWHAATCEHTNEKKDVSGHVDENVDGTCDVCLYDGDHVHTFKDTYSYDANNHWYDADCYHAVKSGEEAHEANALGYCECGYKVSDPDLSTVGKAVALGVSQGNRINGGTVTKTTDNGEAAPYTEYGSFEVGEDYSHTLNYYMIASRWTIEEYWYAKVNDNVIAFERQGDEIVWHNYQVENEVINGWFFDGNETANITGKCYGITDYVESLYEVAVIEAMEGTLVETVEDGVYSFTFDVYHSDSSDDISTISVDFTLADSYYIDTVNVSVQRWYYATDSDGDGVFEKPASAHNWSTEMSLTQRTGDPATKMFDPAEKVLSEFNLYDGDDVVGDTLTVTSGTAKVLDVKDLAPETAADLTYEKITVTGVNADTLEEIDVSFFGDYIGNFVKSTKQLTINFKKVGTYTLTISSRCITKTLTLVVDYADVTSINATVNGVNATTGSTFVDETFTFGTAVNTYAENVATAEFVSVPEGSTLISADIRYNQSTGMFLFMPDVAGEYVIKVTATNNATVSATLTVTVNEKPSVGPLFNGTWTGSVSFVDGAHTISAEFAPDATPVANADFSGTVVVSDSRGMVGGTYKYVYANDTFSVFESDGTTPVSGYKWWVELNADMTMHAVYNAQDKGALVQQASSDEDEPDVSGNPVENTTWAGDISFVGNPYNVQAVFTSDAVTVTTNCPYVNESEKIYAYSYNASGLTLAGDTTSNFYVDLGADNLVHVWYNGMDHGALVKQEVAVGPTFEGTGAESAPYIITELPVEFIVDYKVGGYVYYKYVATEDGAMTITADNNDYWVRVSYDDGNGAREIANNDGDPNPTTVDMTEGGIYVLCLSTWNESVDEQFGISLTWGESTSGGGDEGGDEPVLPDPIQLVMGENTITVTAGDITNDVIYATFWCEVSADYTFANADGIVPIITDDYGYEVRYHVTLNAYTMYQVRLYVGNLEESGDYVLTITNNAPAEFVDGENTISVDEDVISAGIINATYMPMANGDYTFTCPEGISVDVYDGWENYLGSDTLWLNAWETYTVYINVDGSVEAGEYVINITCKEALSLEIGDNTINVTADDIANVGMKFTFFSDEAGEYVFTASDDAILFQILQVNGIPVTSGGTAFLEGYTTYVVTANLASVEAGEYTISIDYNAPLGSYNNPDSIEELPVTLVAPVANPGFSLYYYTLTLDEATDIVITFPNTDSYLTIDSATEQITYAHSQVEYTYSLEAGTYIVGLGTWDDTPVDPVDTVSVTIAVATAEGGEEGGEEGGDATLTGVKTWLGANGSGRPMLVTIDYDNKAISVIRAALAGNSLDLATGAKETKYTFALENGEYTFTKVSGTDLTITLGEDGAPVSIIWESATYTGFVLQA